MYVFPALEGERLAALKATGILDSRPSPEFDAVVELVRDALDVPICLISLMDADRQWFKAKCGLEIEGTDRSLAFCNYALMADDVFVIEDTMLDPRYVDHPLVVGAPHVRFYAGAPLLTAPGLALGTLCVIDVKPRVATTADKLLLQRLAKVVTGLIRGHSLEREAKKLALTARAQSAVVQEQARDLALRERRFLQTERIAKVGGWDLDLVTNQAVWSDETYQIFGLAIGTAVDIRAIRPLYRAPDRTRLDDAIALAIAGGCGFDEEVEFETAVGTRKWLRIVGEVELQETVPSRLFGTVQDVSERRLAEGRLWKAANSDALTGLANRHRFDDMLSAAFFEAGRPHAMLMVDADRLKEVNDTHGHAAGDHLIRTVARRLSEAVGDSGVVARVGGDEFAVLVHDPIGPAQLCAIADRVLAAMRPLSSFGGQTIKPSVSIGGAATSGHEGAEVLRQSADIALYHAKATLRGGYVPFSAGLRSAIAVRIAAVDAVDDAITNGGVVAWYQPIVDLTTGRVSGLEALARIRQGDSLTSIGAFADALHDRRTATRVTACMLDRIAADVVTWTGAGIEVPRIALNVGSLDFEDGNIERSIIATCQRAGIPLTTFTMEVTESVFLSRDASIVSETAARLRAAGVVVALDDFGTGHASLAHLGVFPVDIIKMDRSFIERLGDGGAGAAVTAALIDLAHRLGIQVIAEGIERPDQLARLVELGCDRGQGFLFSQAIPPVDVALFLAAFTAPRAAGYVTKQGTRPIGGSTRAA